MRRLLVILTLVGLVAAACADESSDGSGGDAISTDPACVDMAAMVAAGDFPLEGTDEAALRSAVAAFGTEAGDVLANFIIAPDGVGTISERIVAVDEITLDDCGWPLFGAYLAIADAVRSQEECDFAACANAEIVQPTSLPCLVRSGVDPETLAPGVRYWVPVDCTTNEYVEWDAVALAWLSP
ncbi:MAG: hypothetical protein DHS20C19_20660 [Acidimicrobiales bacterium]|nr:MAG: hypothetical protein DHS20C19_20660 [Acidimicrobiales bacterium]